MDGKKLITDIYAVLQDPSKAKDLGSEAWAQYGWRTAKHALADLRVDDRGPRPAKTLYASELGERCMKKLAYKIHHPEWAEPLLGHNKIKFAYGDIIEELVLQYARAAGYDVANEQMLVETTHHGWNIRGRIDCTINDMVVDVKSTSTYAFNKYTSEGLTPANDSFGYLNQISYYGDRLGKAGAFLMVNKQTGRLHWEQPVYRSTWEPDPTDLEVLADKKAALDIMPRRYVPVPDGKSGNMKLGMECSYCAFKAKCWPGLRAFAYSTGPIFLTHVKNTPRVPEISLVEAAGGA